MDCLVDRTPTLLENIASIGRAINAVEFKKGQIHRLEDFEDIRFTITVQTKVDDATTASFRNGTSIHDTLLRRQPQLYNAHLEREIQHHKQELERHNKASADLTASSVVQIDGYESATTETGLLTPMSTTGIVSRHSTSNAIEENHTMERMTSTSLMDTSADRAASPGLRQVNQQTSNASVRSRRKRSPTGSDDFAHKTRRLKSPTSNPGDSNTSPEILPLEDTGQDDIGTEQTANFLNGKHGNIEPPSKTDNLSTVEILENCVVLSRTQDAMEGIEMRAEQQHHQEPQEVVSVPIILENQVFRPMEDGYNNESLTDFVASMVHTDMFADNVSLSLSPNPNLQRQELHSENAPRTAPDEFSEPKKKSLLSFQHLAEVFRADNHSRPATYPRKPMRQSVQHGIQKMSQWFKGLQIGDESGPERTTSSVVMGYRLAD
jgi:hypothetical protein